MANPVQSKRDASNGQPHACGRKGSFYAGVASTDDKDIKPLSESWQEILL